MQKIKTISIISQGKIKEYKLGMFYNYDDNSVMLERIEDLSLEYPDSFHSHYKGISRKGDVLFEIVNVPVEVIYYKD